jgi:hypothetical protein
MLTKLPKSDSFYIFRLNYQEFILFEHKVENHLNCNYFLFLISYRFLEQQF